MTTIPRELLLLRHARSDWSVRSDDFHRPLQTEGKRDAQRLGSWLMQQGLVPDHVVSSPAERDGREDLQDDDNRHARHPP